MKETLSEMVHLNFTELNRELGFFKNCDDSLSRHFAEGLNRCRESVSFRLESISDPDRNIRIRGCSGLSRELARLDHYLDFAGKRGILKPENHKKLLTQLRRTKSCVERLHFLNVTCVN